MKRRTSTKRKSAKTDWVYRAHVDEANTGPRGTYVSMGTPHDVFRNDPILGTFNSVGMILIDSIAFREVLLNDSFGLSTGLPAAAAPELRGAKAVMVEGDLLMVPSSWAIGNSFYWGYRLGWFEQDTVSGLLSLQAEYSMFEPYIASSTTAQDIVNFANDRQSNVREKFFSRRVMDAGSTQFVTERFATRINRRAPSSKHALALYIEVASLTSINGSIRCFPRLRTLVEVNASG